MRYRKESDALNPLFIGAISLGKYSEARVDISMLRARGEEEGRGSTNYNIPREEGPVCELCARPKAPLLPTPVSRIAYTIDRPPPISLCYQIFTLASRRALPPSTLRESPRGVHLALFTFSLRTRLKGGLGSTRKYRSFPFLEIYTTGRD